MQAKDLMKAALAAMPHGGGEPVWFSIDGIGFGGESDYRREDDGSFTYRIYVWSDYKGYENIRIDIYPYEDKVSIEHPFPEKGKVYTLPFLDNVCQYFPKARWSRRGKRWIYG